MAGGGTGCDDSFGPNACDTEEYPDRPRRDYNEAMDEIAAERRATAGAGSVNFTSPHTHEA